MDHVFITSESIACRSAFNKALIRRMFIPFIWRTKNNSLINFFHRLAVFYAGIDQQRRVFTLLNLSKKCHLFIFLCEVGRLL